MSQANWVLEETVDRSHEIAEARAQLGELAAQQSVTPVDDLNDLKGLPSPDDVGDDDIDQFLCLLQEWRESDLARIR
jgi:hypothetical protein